MLTPRLLPCIALVLCACPAEEDPLKEYTDSDTGSDTAASPPPEVLECVIQTGGCDEILVPDDDNMILLQGSGYWLDDGLDHSGQTLCIPSGSYQHLNFNGLQGSEDSPILITNCGVGQVEVDALGLSSAMAAHGSRYLRVSGTGDPEQEYGIVLKNAGSGLMVIDMQSGVSDIEVDHLEIAGPAYAGIAIRTYPYCDEALSRDVFTQYNTLIHHNYVHDVAGEGLYIGPSHYHEEYSPTSEEECAPGLPEAALRGVEIYNNIVEDTGRDGIQVGAAIEGMSIHHNVIRRYALAEDWGHVGGIQINPGSVGHIFGNFIESDEGNPADNAIQFAGGEDGPTYLYNNIIIGTKAPFLALSRMGNSDSPVHLLNNTVVSNSDGGKTIYLYCDAAWTQDFFVTNNIFTGYAFVGSYLYTDGSGQVWSKIVDSNAANCPINGLAHDNDLDENQAVEGNLYMQEPSGLGFVDLDGGDYHLEGSSPAVGTGENLSSIFTDDFEGNERGDGPFDMGAYRY